MNARRTLLILGAGACLLVASITALAIFLHRKMELEKNQVKTASARANRWRPKEPIESEESSQAETEEKKTVESHEQN